jgi:hypothetical protein
MMTMGFVERSRGIANDDDIQQISGFQLLVSICFGMPVPW